MWISGLITLLSLITPGLNSNQDNDVDVRHTGNSGHIVHSLSLITGFDYYASSVGDEIREEIPPEDKIAVHTGIPLSLKYSFSFNDPSVRNYLAGGYQGLAVSILNIGSGTSGGFEKAHHNIGYPVSAYLFQGGPFWHINHNFTLDYEWNFGASFGWKPYSEANKFFNLTVGSKVNAYLSLALICNWHVNPHTSLFAGINVSHFSNGNTSWPNPGINSMGLRLGVIWTINPPESGFAPNPIDTVSKKKLEYDIMAWGTSRRRVYKGEETPVLRPGHFACAGLSFAPMVKLNKWWRVGGSADLQWDQSSDMKRNYLEGTTTEDIRFSNPPFLRQVSFGISAHGELQMPIFSVNVGIGFNLVAPSENRGTYQNIALKTYLCKEFFLNVGYQLRNFHQQSSLMLGVGTTI